MRYTSLLTKQRFYPNELVSHESHLWYVEDVEVVGEAFRYRLRHWIASERLEEVNEKTLLASLTK